VGAREQVAVQLVRKVSRSPLIGLLPFAGGTPRGLFGSMSLMAAHSWSVSSSG
jgi:hypothetical protein